MLGLLAETLLKEFFRATASAHGAHFATSSLMS